MNTNSRIVGSGFSAFYFNHQPIAFLDDITDSGQQPITQYQAVTPLGASYPVEFALPRVRQEGTLQFTIRELWNQPVWWALGQNTQSTTQAGKVGTGIFDGGTGQTGAPAVGSGPNGASVNIVDIYNQMAATPTPIVCATVISVPAANGTPAGYRGWVYNNVTITQIDDREQIQIGTLTMPRTIQAVYSYKTYLTGVGNYTA